MFCELNLKLNLNHSEQNLEFQVSNSNSKSQSWNLMKLRCEVLYMIVRIELEEDFKLKFENSNNKKWAMVPLGKKLIVPRELYRKYIAFEKVPSIYQWSANGRTWEIFGKLVKHTTQHPAEERETSIRFRSRTDRLEFTYSPGDKSFHAVSLNYG